MSKEREVFEDWWIYAPKEIPITVRQWCQHAFQAAKTHYQLLFDAKDAEIARLRVLNDKQALFLTNQEHWRKELQAENTRLKALLEQAREGLGLVIDDMSSGGLQNRVLKKVDEALAAIHAEIGVK